MKKNILLAMFAFLLFICFNITNGIAQESIEDPPGGPSSGCSFDVMGTKFPCTKIWCSETMSMSGCGLGEAASQTCSTYKDC